MLGMRAFRCLAPVPALSTRPRLQHGVGREGCGATNPMAGVGAAIDSPVAALRASVRDTEGDMTDVLRAGWIRRCGRSFPARIPLVVRFRNSCRVLWPSVDCGGFGWTPYTHRADASHARFHTDLSPELPCGSPGPGPGHRSPTIGQVSARPVPGTPYLTSRGQFRQFRGHYT
jgi:hypothetical protein